jgi:spectinomycin phosphotransferase
MLERPVIEEATLVACLRDVYGLHVRQVTFLPLGADPHTAVFRADEAGGTTYFLKLRGGDFDETSVTLPRFLYEQGISQIIAPIASREGRLWAGLGDFTAIVYPFVEGKDAYEAPLSEAQWVEFGATLRKLHALNLPAHLKKAIRREKYAPTWRAIVRRWLQHVEAVDFDEPLVAETSALLRRERNVILDLMERAEQYAAALTKRSLKPVVCHTDLHAGNFLLTEDRFYIVDWDEPLLAPKERDLMYAGAGLMGGWSTPQEEESLFYRGYGLAGVDRTAIAYYRMERIIADIAVYCEQLLRGQNSDEERRQSLRYLRSNFLPGGAIEIAFAADQS